MVSATGRVRGRVKARLTAPCTPLEAATLAAGALADTLETVATTPCARRVLALQGRPPNCLPQGFEVVPQRGRGLDERLAAAFEDIGGPALLIGMDTPQAGVGLLSAALRALREN